MNKDSKLIVEAYSDMNKSVSEALVLKMMEVGENDDPAVIMGHLLFTLEKKIPQVKEMLQGILDTLNQGR